MLSSRGDLHPAAQRQWADYICLKDNAVIQHICWARVERVIPLPNPSPHSVKGRRWTAFSSAAHVPEEDVERIFCEIAQHDGAERAIGDIVSDWMVSRDRPIVRRMIHPEFLQLLCSGACEHIPAWYDTTVKFRGQEIARGLGIEPEKIEMLSNLVPSLQPLPLSLNASLFANAAMRIRGHPVDKEGGAEPEHRVLEWLDRMAEQCEFGLEHLKRPPAIGFSKTSAYNFESLLQSLCIASMMKDDANLRHMICSVGELLGLPQGFLLKLLQGRVLQLCVVTG